MGYIDLILRNLQINYQTPFLG